MRNERRTPGSAKGARKPPGVSRGRRRAPIQHPTLIERVTEAGQRIVKVLNDHEYFEYWRAYEDLEAEVGWVRERASFSLGWEHGSADGRAEAFRSQAPGLSKRARRLADQARALVVNGHLTSVEAAALLAETLWAILLTKPAPSFEG